MVITKNVEEYMEGEDLLYSTFNFKINIVIVLVIIVLIVSLIGTFVSFYYKHIYS